MPRRSILLNHLMMAVFPHKKMYLEDLKKDIERIKHIGGFSDVLIRAVESEIQELTSFLAEYKDKYETHLKCAY